MSCSQLFVVFLLGASDHEDGFTVLLVEFKHNLHFSLFGGWQSISFFGALWWSNESKNQTQSPSQADTLSSATRPISQIDISTNAQHSLCLLRGYGHLRPIPPKKQSTLRNNHWPKDLSWLLFFLHGSCGKQKENALKSVQRVSNKTGPSSTGSLTNWLSNFSQSSIVKAPLVFLIKQLLKIEVPVCERTYSYSM